MPRMEMPQTVQYALQTQMNHELAASHGYTALSVWCYARNLKGFASYFQKQAGEERQHALKIMDFMMNRQVDPKLSALPEPPEVKTLMEVAKTVVQMEKRNTEGVHIAYDAATDAGDTATRLMLEWFVKEQVEEEDWTQEMLERVKGANCAGGVAELDRHIIRYLSQEFYVEPVEE